jgi:hypothetical protein
LEASYIVAAPSSSSDGAILAYIGRSDAPIT